MNDGAPCCSFGKERRVRVCELEVLSVAVRAGASVTMSLIMQDVRTFDRGRLSALALSKQQDLDWRLPFLHSQPLRLDLIVNLLADSASLRLGLLSGPSFGGCLVGWGLQGDGEGVGTVECAAHDAGCEEQGGSAFGSRSVYHFKVWEGRHSVMGTAELIMMRTNHRQR